MNKEKIVEEVKKLIAAPSCFPELREAGEKYLSSIGKDNENECFDAIVKGAEACKSSIDACIAFLKSDMGKQIYGAQAEAVLKDAEDKKAAGEDTCICGACQACKHILENAK